MTQSEFQKTSFGRGDKVEYRGNMYLLAAVDFEEQLIGFVSEEDFDSGDYEYSWARCENCKVYEKLNCFIQK